MTVDPSGMTARKRRHIDACLTDAVGYHGVTTGLERYRLPYNALRHTRREDVDLSTNFLGKRPRAPVLIGAMPGGAELSGVINRNLPQPPNGLTSGGWSPRSTPCWTARSASRPRPASPSPT